MRRSHHRRQLWPKGKDLRPGKRRPAIHRRGQGGPTADAVRSLRYDNLKICLGSSRPCYRKSSGQRSANFETVLVEQLTPSSTQSHKVGARRQFSGDSNMRRCAASVRSSRPDSFACGVNYFHIAKFSAGSVGQLQVELPGGRNYSSGTTHSCQGNGGKRGKGRFCVSGGEKRQHQSESNGSREGKAQLPALEPPRTTRGFQDR